MTPSSTSRGTTSTSYRGGSTEGACSRRDHGRRKARRAPATACTHSLRSPVTRRMGQPTMEARRSHPRRRRCEFFRVNHRFASILLVGVMNPSTTSLSTWPALRYCSSELRSASRLPGVQRDNILIEFGLGHGCEVVRGTFTAITIEVPRPRSLRAQVRLAGRSLGSIRSRI